jgi:alcohol dehydrogenase, propanol-preferring
VYSALLRSEAKPGSWVVISGAGGGLGNLACQIGSKALGFRIIGIDHPSKRDLVLGSGAEHFVDMTQFPNDDDIVAHVQALTGGLGAHAVVVCVASNRAYAQATKFLRFNGTLVCVGLPEGALIPIAGAIPQRLVMKQLRVVGSLVGNQREAIGVLDFAARGIVKGQIEVKKMEDLTQVFEDMGAGKLHGRVVLDLSA